MFKPVILVTGKNGQLGRELQALASMYPQYQFVFTDRSELDITNMQEVNSYFEKALPQYCVNAAAYTAVDKAETEKDLAMRVNAEAVSHLASACRRHKTQFIHISTDYVFSGTANAPYDETDEINPVNYYGLTKLMGEQNALTIDPSSIIIRTSWVYSAYGNNFVKTMLRLMADRETVKVVNDQYGSPTYAADLAEAILEIISFLSNLSSAGGLYHYSNEGNITWYDFAIAIKELSASPCNVVPIPTSEFPTPAKRPHWSIMSKEKICSEFSLQLSPWQDSLKRCFIALRGKA